MLFILNDDCFCYFVCDIEFMFFLKFLDIIYKDRCNKEGMFFLFGDLILNVFMSLLMFGLYSGFCKVVFGSC